MSKVLLVGVEAPTYSSSAMISAFRAVFGECLFFDWQRVRFNLGVDGMRGMLIDVAKKQRPDIVFLHFNHNSEALSVDNYKSLAENSIVICYTEDVRDNIDWFRSLSSIVDICVFTNRNDVDELSGENKVAALYMPVSFNNDIYFKRDRKECAPYGDIVFIGNNYANTNMAFPEAVNRQSMISAMQSKFGNKFMAYGSGQRNRMLNAIEASQAYCSAKISITHNNYQRDGYQSDRGLNSMGCGCATVINHYNGVYSQFPNMIGGVWATIDQLIYLCETYLGNDFVRNQLAAHQYEHVMKNYTWFSRAGQLKEYLKSIFGSMINK